VLEGINPASQLIPVERIEGITTIMASAGGGLISGQAVALGLWGDRIEDMVIKSPVAPVGQINEGAKGTGGGSRAGVMAREYNPKLVIEGAVEGWQVADQPATARVPYEGLL